MTSSISCEEVLLELSNYIDGVVPTRTRREMDSHFRFCESCAAVLESTRNVVEALGDDRLIEVPPGYSARMEQRLRSELRSPYSVGATPSMGQIECGITPGQVDLGSHLICFWENDQEFSRGVHFLELGLSGEDHCVVFGHKEATDKVFRQLEANGFDTASLLRNRRITLLRRESPAPTTLSNIQDIFEAALREGAPAIRYLGNLGFGKEPLPGSGFDDVLELEAKATALARRFPAVVVCMYDLNTLPGRLILKGGFQTHPLTVCGDHLQHNPYYIPEAEFIRDLRPGL